MAEMPTLEFRWEHPHVQYILGGIVIGERIQNADSTCDTLATLAFATLL